MVVPTRARAILVGNLVSFVVASILITGRLYARAFLLRHVGIDDYLLVLGWLAALVNCVLATLGTRYGSGMHEIDIPDKYLVPALKLNYATTLCYQASLCFTKLSICVFYLRVFSTTKASRWQVYAMIAFVVAFTVPLEVVTILSCVPPQKTWLPAKSGHCLNTIIAFWTSVACNIISDVWIIVFAAPRVWSLKMQGRQKLALLATLTLGWIVVIAAVIRAVRVGSILHSADATWRSYDSSIWSAVEVNVSIVCASAPALKPIFKQYVPGFMYSVSDGKKSNTKPSNGARSWVKAGQNGTGTFEMSRSVTHLDLTSQSQEELANSTGQNRWITSKMDTSSSADELSEENPELDGNGIMKSTEVTVRHWPIQGLRGGS
ncbi:hypothetical protein LTR85_010461 [Meristemomyces frigidus]|nr:hypothetical protein LTR85_010461 [Meristemomyces frigidus]